jgi:predicted nucleic acid-binding protein
VTLYTIDASVLVNAFHPGETGHEQSRLLLQKIRQLGLPMIEPALVLPEVAAAIARGQDDSSLATRFVQHLVALRQLLIVAIDGATARLAAEIAATHRLRGADSVYAAVAQRFGSTLVTLDQEQLTRVATLIPTRTPAAALAELSS